jgi:hypothetical protein
MPIFCAQVLSLVSRLYGDRAEVGGGAQGIAAQVLG